MKGSEAEGGGGGAGGGGVEEEGGRVMGGTGPSGVGKAYDMSQLDQLLQALAKGGEAVMREIMLPTRQMRRSTVRLRVHSDSGAWCVSWGVSWGVS